MTLTFTVGSLLKAEQLCAEAAGFAGVWSRVRGRSKTGEKGSASGARVWGSGALGEGDADKHTANAEMQEKHGI